MAFGYITGRRMDALDEFLCNYFRILNQEIEKGGKPFGDKPSKFRFPSSPHAINLKSGRRFMDFPTAPNGPGQMPILLKRQLEWTCWLANSLQDPYRSHFMCYAQRQEYKMVFLGKLGRRNVPVLKYLKDYPELAATKIEFRDNL